EPLLDGDGPLGDLSIRLKLIYGLGVLSRTEYELPLTCLPILRWWNGFCRSDFPVKQPKVAILSG
ncbi:mannitol repressor protein, partial [Salmonella enterica subsp. enterica serovar Enteritidis str. 13183-1]